MIELITILISLLGYGQVSDFDIYTQDQIATEIQLIEDFQADGGNLTDWDSSLH